MILHERSAKVSSKSRYFSINQNDIPQKIIKKNIIKKNYAYILEKYNCFE
jgi:hypothetical protein